MFSVQSLANDKSLRYEPTILTQALRGGTLV